MSQAFVKENDEEWLHDVQPTVNALIVYLTRQNNGIRVYEKSVDIDKRTGKELHKMSNGLDYVKDGNGQWEMIF